MRTVSYITAKPIPPRIIVKLIVKLIMGSPVKDSRLFGKSAKPALQNADTAWNAAKPSVSTDTPMVRENPRYKNPALIASTKNVEPTITRSALNNPDISSSLTIYETVNFSAIDSLRLKASIPKNENTIIPSPPI